VKLFTGYTNNTNAWLINPLRFSGGSVGKGPMRNPFMFSSISTAHRNRIHWFERGKRWDNLPRPQSTDGGTPNLSEIQYVVVDVETHDWLNCVQYTRNNHIARVVELAWVAYDNDGQEIEARQYLLKPHGGYVAVSRKAENYHGISNKMVNDWGCSADLVFDEFTNILSKIPHETGFVIARNMRHEDAVFYNNLNEHGRDVWVKTPKCDTWATSLLKQLPKEKSIKYEGRKFGLKLIELHGIVSSQPKTAGTDRGSSHNALADALMAWDIFWYYKKVIRDKHLDERQLLEWRHIG
jgi:DNA polymerase III epsilon subunit-like protein